MKTILAIVLLLGFTACFGQKPEKYEMTSTEAISLMQLHEQAVLAQQQAQYAIHAFTSYKDTVRQGHGWSNDIDFDGREWKKV